MLWFYKFPESVIRLTVKNLEELGRWQHAGVTLGGPRRLGCCTRSGRNPRYRGETGSHAALHHPSCQCGAGLCSRGLSRGASNNTVLSKASTLNVDGESDRVRRAGVCVGPGRSATSACFLRVPAPAQRGAVSDLACPRCPGGCAKASSPPRGPPPTPRGWRTAPCVFLRGRTALAHSTAGPGRRSGVPRGCGGGSAPGTCRGRAALVWPLGLWWLLARPWPRRSPFLRTRPQH